MHKLTMRFVPFMEEPSITMMWIKMEYLWCDLIRVYQNIIISETHAEWEMK